MDTPPRRSDPHRVAEIINLNRVRKARAKAEQAARAAENRARHSRTKGDTQRNKAESARSATELEGKRLSESPESPVPDSDPDQGG